MQEHDFLRVELIDPEALRDGKSTEEATVLVVGALLLGDSTHLADLEPEARQKNLKTLQSRSPSKVVALSENY